MMRLLRCTDAGEAICFKDFIGEDAVPAYAILSHTWEKSQEVTYKDIVDGTGKEKSGYKKIQFCREQAREDKLEYFWVDTCCINKDSSAELSEAINSMIRWYHNATRCYVFLSDVSSAGADTDDQSIQPPWEPSFRKSRWFKRGWTLQELLASNPVEFFSHESERLGNKSSLKRQIHEITGIPDSALQGASLSYFSIDDRFSWMELRQTTREEDKAYSMLGIFDVSMGLIYGEGRHKALKRLREEINKATNELFEPASKRRRIELDDLNVDHTLAQRTQITKEVLLDFLRFNEIDDRFINIKDSHSETCRGLLGTAQWLDWLNRENLLNHHGIFWIKGKSGCGKSTLMKYAFTELQNSLRDTILLSFFFNARGTHLEKSTIGLYRSLLVQLLTSIPSDPLCSVPNVMHWQLDEKLKTTPEKLKFLLVQVLRNLKPHDITVVVDALDECDEDEVRDMIALFEKLGDDAVSDGRAFRILFSSRHYPRITIPCSVELILENQDGHSQDIETYLTSVLCVRHDRSAEQLRKEIRNRASGVFMWVVLVVGILNKAFDRGQVHTLQTKLQEIPKDLSELLRSILTRDQQNMDETKLCIQWILFAKLPFKREELYFAILSGLEPKQLIRPWDAEEISTEDMDLFILSSSKGLAEITNANGWDSQKSHKRYTVQFIHESVRDFLLNENGLGQIWPDLEANATGISHNRLKECCFEYTISELSCCIGDLDYLPSNPSQGIPSHLSGAVNLHHPFLKYAVNNISIHAEISHAEGIDQVGFVQEFELGHWVHLQNIIKGNRSSHLPQDISILYVLAKLNCPTLIDAVISNPRSRHSQNVDVNAQGGFYGTALQAAAFHDYEQVVKLLLDQGADVNAQGGEYGNALQAAALGAKEQVVKLLLDQGADVNAQGGRFGTALQGAAYRGHEQVVKLLLDQGADVNARGGYAGSALQAAKSSPRLNEKVVKLLLDWGAEC